MVCFISFLFTLFFSLFVEITFPCFFLGVKNFWGVFFSIFFFFSLFVFFFFFIFFPVFFYFVVFFFLTVNFFFSSSCLFFVFFPSPETASYLLPKVSLFRPFQAGPPFFFLLVPFFSCRPSPRPKMAFVLSVVFSGVRRGALFLLFVLKIPFFDCGPFFW